MNTYTFSLRKKNLKQIQLYIGLTQLINISFTDHLPIPQVYRKVLVHSMMALTFLTIYHANSQV